MAETHTSTVVIIGAGFSGAAIAAQLLRQAAVGRLRIVLVNESGRMARGLAYGTHSTQHVLNVPAGNMSALADDPENFVRYCRWSDPSVSPSSFVPRRFYGAYLEALLGAAEFSGNTSVTLERVVGRVQAVRLPSSGQGQCAVEMSSAHVIQAEHVVLAFGHFPPSEPLSCGVLSALGSRYIGDPWRPDALSKIDSDDSVLLLGAGLTAVDVALSLARDGRNGRLVAVSRRGLRPNPHREGGAPPAVVDAKGLHERLGRTMREQLRSFRCALREYRAAGGDWRDMVGALRPHTPDIWQRWSDAERSRFLRHLRPYWDAARHRCAPEAYACFERLEQSGTLRLHGARVVSVQRREDGIDVVMRRRGSSLTFNERVQYVVNCTGPSSDVGRSESALVGGLLADGLITPDGLGLGLKVDADGAVVDAQGRSSRLLSYIGPLLKARDWEATAVPELRVHAQRLAHRLLATLDVA